MSSKSFLEALELARKQSDAADWESAAESWELVVAANPVEGRFWSRLGEAAFESAGHQRAIEAWERAIELGAVVPAMSAYRIAQSHALSEHREQALAWLQRSIEMGFRDLAFVQTDDHLRSLRGDPRFRELVGLHDLSGWSRDDGWRYDIDWLVHETERKGHHVIRETAEGEFRLAADELSERVPGLSDTQVVIELMRLVQRLGDGHAGVYGSKKFPELDLALPVQFYVFEEGLFVIASTPEYRKLLGVEVVQIDGHAIDEAQAQLVPLISRDNNQWIKHMTPFLLRQTAILHGLGLIDQPDQVSLDVVGRDGMRRSVTVVAEQLPRGTVLRRTNPPFDPGWVQLAQTIPAPVPLYLRDLDAAYWFTLLESSRTVYFQFNRVANEPDEDFPSFSERLFDFIDQHDVDRLVIDVRWNSGGNTFLELPFLRRLIGDAKVNRPGGLFVIIGRKTFSAAQNFSTFIERFASPIFVGEPTGSRPNFLGETIPFRLPYSGVQVNISDLYWQSSWPMDYRTWIAPSLYAPPTFAAFLEGRDCAMEAIDEYEDHLPGAIDR